MKKIATGLLALTMAFTMIFSLAACKKKEVNVPTTGYTTTDTTVSEYNANTPISDEVVKVALESSGPSSWDGNYENLTGEQKSTIENYFAILGKGVEVRADGVYYIENAGVITTLQIATDATTAKNTTTAKAATTVKTATTTVPTATVPATAAPTNATSTTSAPTTAAITTTTAPTTLPDILTQGPVGGSTAEIVAFYNQYANATKAYKGKVAVARAQGTKAEITKLTPENPGFKFLVSPLLPNNYGTKTAITFFDGKNISGGSETLMNTLPRSNSPQMSVLEPAGVKSASCEKAGSGWKVIITVISETVNSFTDVPKYHAQCMDTASSSGVSIPSLPGLTINSVSINYGETTITATVSTKGYLDNFHIVEPVVTAVNLSYNSTPSDADITATWKQDLTFTYK